MHEETSFVTDSDNMATAKNKLRNLIVVSERKRGLSRISLHLHGKLTHLVCTADSVILLVRIAVWK